jgi:hypothetical protein
VLALPLAIACTGPSTHGSVGTPTRPAGGASGASGSRTPAGKSSSAAFWRGTDGFPIPVTGTGPYRMPVIGGRYGGYIGMAGNWAHWQGCGGKLIWSAANADHASVNLTRFHVGVGVAAFWFMAGPGVDPRYDATVAEARRWGQHQAARALANLNGTVNYPVIWMDVELPGNAPDFTPAADNGWKDVYTAPCSGLVKIRHIAPAVDRGVIDGFASYLTAHSKDKPGVYSAPPAWTKIFGTGSASKIPGLYEWTYTQNTSSLTRHPSAWCLTGASVCAHFFGGQHSSDKTALMWQWSGGGGTSNGVGDFDQIDGTRTP